MQILGIATAISIISNTQGCLMDSSARSWHIKLNSEGYLSNRDKLSTILSRNFNNSYPWIQRNLFELNASANDSLCEFLLS